MTKKSPYSFEDQQSLDNWMVSDSNISDIQNIITSCKKNPFLYKFISANDAGSTGSHQSGLYLPNSSWPIFFDSPGIKGKNKDRPVTIQWETDEIETKSRCIWYGAGTRSEYRLTRFGKGFPYLKDEHIGSLVILVKNGKDEFSGWVLDSDNDIETFLAEFEISHLDAGGIKNIKKTTPVELLQNPIRTDYLKNLLAELEQSFPIRHSFLHYQENSAIRSGLPLILMPGLSPGLIQNMSCSVSLRIRFTSRISNEGNIPSMKLLNLPEAY